MAKYYKMPDETPLGGYDGTEPPEGAIEITHAEYAAMVAVVPEPDEMEVIKDALKTKGLLTDADINASKDKLKGA